MGNINHISSMQWYLNPLNIFLVIKRPL